MPVPCRGQSATSSVRCTRFYSTNTHPEIPPQVRLRLEVFRPQSPRLEHLGELRIRLSLAEASDLLLARVRCEDN